MDLLVGTSLVAAFIAGVAALFAPCCITVLLPSYLGSIFRERRTVFLMTFVFFLGILAVFLPLGFGSAAFGQFLSKNHTLIFALGGTALLLLGASLLTGRHLSLPFRVNPTLRQHNAGSVFLLGVFSGVATTCCAPVLAGVLALAALPGSVFWGVLYTVAYVLGMVAPLFLLAAALDTPAATKRLMALRKPLAYRLGRFPVRLSLTDAISGAVFVAMGILTLWLAATNRLAVHSAYQVNLNILVTKLLRSVNGAVTAIPEAGWAVLISLALVGLTWRVLHLLKKEQHHEESH